MSRPVLVAMSATILLAGCGTGDGQPPAQTSTVDTTIPESETIEPAPSPTTTSVPREKVEAVRDLRDEKRQDE